MRAGAMAVAPERVIPEFLEYVDVGRALNVAGWNLNVLMTPSPPDFSHQIAESIPESTIRMNNIKPCVFASRIPDWRRD